LASAMRSSASTASCRGPAKPGKEAASRWARTGVHADATSAGPPWSTRAAVRIASSALSEPS
jgi:hypothetical protein